MLADLCRRLRIFQLRQRKNVWDRGDLFCIVTISQVEPQGLLVRTVRAIDARTGK
jgi:hypothetical protein